MDDIKNLVQLWRQRGMTLGGIADRLTANGIRNGEKPYNARDVSKMLPKKEKQPGLTLAEKRQRRIDTYDDLRPRMWHWRRKGLTLSQIAERLNAGGHRTVSGKPIDIGLVSVLLRRPLW